MTTKIPKRLNLKAGLVALGFKLQRSKDDHRKYVKYDLYTKPCAVVEYLVGDCGALRRKAVGAPLATSVSLTDKPFCESLIELGRISHQLTTEEQAKAVFNDLQKKGNSNE